MRLSIQEITDLQSEHGMSDVQAMINDGSAWTLEGSVGRFAMDCLKRGVCFLPNEHFYDTYGNKVPRRSSIKEGSFGSLSLSSLYWSNLNLD